MTDEHSGDDEHGNEAEGHVQHQLLDVGMSAGDGRGVGLVVIMGRCLSQPGRVCAEAGLLVPPPNDRPTPSLPTPSLPPSLPPPTPSLPQPLPPSRPCKCS